jgi:hypothetical protein
MALPTVPLSSPAFSPCLVRKPHAEQVDRTGRQNGQNGKKEESEQIESRLPHLKMRRTPRIFSRITLVAGSTRGTETGSGTETETTSKRNNETEWLTKGRV